MHDPNTRQPLHDIADLDPEGLPSRRSLMRASVLAVAIAALLLVVVVLPAEYGVDPTGLGARMGLDALHRADAAEIDTGGAPVAADSPLSLADAPYRSDEITLNLPPGQGAEIKAVMALGQRFTFEWRAEGGPVYVDMHGDPPNADADTFTSFRVGASVRTASGNFRAPFDGRHGWYWENR